MFINNIRLYIFRFRKLKKESNRSSHEENYYEEPPRTEEEECGTHRYDDINEETREISRTGNENGYEVPINIANDPKYTSLVK